MDTKVKDFRDFAEGLMNPDTKSYEAHDVMLVCISFSLLYLYQWLDLKQIIFADIDAAYGPTVDTQTKPLLDEPPKTIEVSLPYEPGAIIGPLFACLIKTMLWAFVLFVLIHLGVDMIAASMSIDCQMKYVKKNVVDGIFKCEQNVKPWLTSPHELIKKDDDDEPPKPKWMPKFQKQESKEESATKQAQIGGALFQKKEETPEDKIAREEKEREDKEERERKKQEKAKQKQEQAEKQRYTLGKDVDTIWILNTDPDDAKLLKALDNAKTYWFFFLRLQNIHITVILLIATLCVNFIYTNLIIPHVANIDKDGTQMKCQVETLLYINLFIYLGGIWYMALQTLS